jgi:hypothetical protein
VSNPDPNSQVKAHPVTNLPLTGSPTVLFASVLRNQFYANSILTIENIDSQENIVHLVLLNVQASLVYSSTFHLRPGEDHTFDVGDEEKPLPEQFNGSAIVTATRLDGKTPGKIVGSVLELGSVYLGAKSFEGVSHGSVEVFMPSAACNFDIGGQVFLNTAYAVQNTSFNSPTDVTVTYSNGSFKTQSIAPGAKASLLACQTENMPTNFLGAAVLRSSSAPIVAIGKVFGGGLSTAFTGAPAGSGTKNLALPYIRWATEENWNNGTQQRTFITIQNIGSDFIHGNILVYYVPCRGQTVTHEIRLGNAGLAPGDKVNSKPSDANIIQFGACENGPQMSGSAIVIGPDNSQLAAVVRVEQWDQAHGIVAGEDYNAIMAP